MSKGKDLVQEILAAEYPEQGTAMWWLSQMGLVVKGAGKICSIDCFLTDMESRLVPPVIAAEEFSFPDFIIGTHDHADHIDHDLWKTAAKLSDAKFVIPAYFIDELPQILGIEAGRFIGIRAGETTELCEGITVTGLAEAHEFLDYNEEKDEFPYLGYLLDINGYRILHCGDCCNYEGFISRILKLGHIDMMMLPISGRDAYRYTHNCIGNMTYQEAVDVAGFVKPDIAVPGHYDMFRGNTEDPEKFREYMSVKYPNQKVWIGKPGDRITV